MKLLILSDAVTAPSGFARIARDLATRISTMGEVYTCGYGSPTSRSLPFYQYHISDPLINGWQVVELPEIYNDICPNEEELTILVIWDLSRILWLADPQYCTIPHLKNFLEHAPIKKVIYVPIDAYGIDGKLSQVLAHTASKFEILAYTQFGADVLEKTFDKKFPHIPHGIDTSIFYPRPVRKSLEKLEKKVFGQSLRDSFLVGSVMTNQKRKDFWLLFATVKELLNRGKDVKLWLNTDKVINEWSLNSLVGDFGLQGRVAVTLGIDNDELATYYSACDAIALTSLGEGFGYVPPEATFCGTPCFHGNYAGAPEFTLNREFLIEPVAYYHEGPYLNCRPVYRPEDFANSILKHYNVKPKKNERLDWNILWKEWEPWVRGLNEAK